MKNMGIQRQSQCFFKLNTPDFSGNAQSFTAISSNGQWRTAKKQQQNENRHVSKNNMKNISSNFDSSPENSSTVPKTSGEI